MKKQNSGTKPQRTVFSKEFKLAAVARMREGKQNVTALAFELGVRRNQLYKWAEAFDQLGRDASFAGPGRPSVSANPEVVRLQRELDDVKEELAILKKFDAYLTRHQQ